MGSVMRGVCSLAIVLAVAGGGHSIRGAEKPALDLESGPDNAGPTIVVRGLPASVLQGTTSRTDEQWHQLLAVFTVQRERVSPTRLLGDYAISDSKLVFSPRFPLRPGMTYRAVLRPFGTSTEEFTRDFTLPSAKPVPATRLTAIYPTRDVLPENLLKFYLHFSAPMSRGEVYQRVRLLDEQGRKVESPFLELSEELWSPDGMRLTLYFDPGRIKRGLKPRELFGPALIEAHSYSLQIDTRWPDANGQSLSGPEWIKKSFRVTAPDDQQPRIRDWKVIPPRAGSRDPLTVVFDEPLDSAMLVRVLTVRSQGGDLVAGGTEIGKEEATWQFRPASNWVSGKYLLIATSSLEDLAGNSLGRPFEVDVFRAASPDLESAMDSISFEIAGSR